MFAVAVGELDGRPVIVTGGQDGTVRVWDLEGRRAARRAAVGRGRERGRGAVAELDGRPVIVAGGAEGTVQVWDLDGGTPLGVPLRHRNASVLAGAQRDGIGGGQVRAVDRQLRRSSSS